MKKLKLLWVIDALEIGSSLGWRVALEQGRFATEPVAARENAHRIGAELLGLQPSDAARDRLDPAGILPLRIERMRVDADLGFTAPWDRAAIEVARPQITDIDLRDLSAEWGNMTFRAAGALTVDAAGIPSGEITIRAVGWQRLLDMAIAGGLLPEASRSSLELALGLLASMSGPPDTIDAPLTLRGGRISLGPVPLGPAPRLIIR